MASIGMLESTEIAVKDWLNNDTPASIVKDNMD